MHSIEDTKRVVREVAEQQLHPARVIDVSVKEDFDQTGERILRVRLVMDVGNEKLDPARVVGLVRHLREPLAQIEEDRFPVLTFMKPGEVNGAVA